MMSFVRLIVSLGEWFSASFFQLPPVSGHFISMRDVIRLGIVPMFY
jgi:hypothetical protein